MNQQKIARTLNIVAKEFGTKPEAFFRKPRVLNHNMAAYNAAIYFLRIHNQYIPRHLAAIFKKSESSFTKQIPIVKGWQPGTKNHQRIQTIKSRL